MKKPIREEYYLAPHLQHLSPEMREEVYISDLNKYKQSLRSKKRSNIFDFQDEQEEVLL